MRTAGKVCADILSDFSSIIKPGITTLELDRIAENRIQTARCIPAFKGCYGFPNTICASVNDGVVHCKPTDKPLKNGDIVTIDIGAIYEGFYSDTAKTYIVGSVSPDIEKFVSVGYESLLTGIKQALDGNVVNDISKAVYKFASNYDYGVVKEYVGHGIGTFLHEDPKIPNTPESKPTPQLSNGMVICIEPILTFKKPAETKHIEDWDIRTCDGSLAVHFEHTIAILPTGPEVLTLRQDEEKI